MIQEPYWTFTGYHHVGVMSAYILSILYILCKDTVLQYIAGVSVLTRVYIISDNSVVYIISDNSVWKIYITMR